MICIVLIFLLIAACVAGPKGVIRAFLGLLTLLAIALGGLVLLVLGLRSYSPNQAASEQQQREEERSAKEQHETVAAQLREKGLHIYTFNLLFDGHKRTKPLPLTCYTGGMILARSPEAAYKRLNDIASTDSGRADLMGGRNEVLGPSILGITDVTELSEAEAATTWINSESFITDNDLFNIVPDPTPTPTPIVQQVEMTSTPDSKPPGMRPPTTKEMGSPQTFAPTPTPQELSDSAYWKIKARSMSGGPPD